MHINSVFLVNFMLQSILATFNQESKASFGKVRIKIY